MTEATLYLFESPSKKHRDETYPIVLKVTHNRARRYFKTGIHCQPIDWDKDTCRLKKSFPRSKEINDRLTKFEQKAKKLIEKFQFEDRPFTFQEFELEFLQKNDKALLGSYFEEWIDKFRKEEHIGSANVYAETLSSLRKFRKGVDSLKLQNIDHKFLTDFEHFLRTESKMQDTSISIRMRTLKAVFNKAIKEGIVKREFYPFDKYKLSEHLNTATSKRAISKAHIEKIAALSLTPDTGLWFARDIFLFSYYTRGINFADIAYLKAENLQDGHLLSYFRKKTKKQFIIQLHEKAIEILKSYQQHKKRSGDYFFPVFDDQIHRNEVQKTHRRKTVNKEVNKNLKIIAEMIGLEGIKLTTYVSRHTYANVLKQSGTSISMISEAMGHQTEKTTQIYLKSFGDDELAEIDRRVL
ncbi:MAG: site-specific integrase [Haliscomenobacter sp.]|nr:site-specific integrase [Haliscomenobacter sp.]